MPTIHQAAVEEVEFFAARDGCAVSAIHVWQGDPNLCQRIAKRAGVVERLANRHPLNQIAAVLNALDREVRRADARGTVPRWRKHKILAAAGTKGGGTREIYYRAFTLNPDA